MPIKYSTHVTSSTPKKEVYIVEYPEENVSKEFLSTIKEAANEVVDDVISEAENVSLNLDDSLHLAVKKSEEAFSFLEHEEHEPVTPVKEFDNDMLIREEMEIFSDNKDVNNIPVETISIVTTKVSTKNKSNIPKLRNKEKYLKDEKDIDVVLGDDDNLTPSETDILSRIPVATTNKPIKVKTIKKHSKDPLKDFAKMIHADGGNWDESKFNDSTMSEQTTYTSTKTEPDGTVTTTTTIEYSTGPEIKETTIQFDCNDKPLEANNLSSPKSKIPVFLNESGKLNSPTDSQKDIVDSDSDTDSRQSPPLRGILKKSSMRTLGSSSGSDIALHEAGGELSDDDTGKLEYFLL